MMSLTMMMTMTIFDDDFVDDEIGYEGEDYSDEEW